MTREGCGMLVSPKWCRQCSCCLARSGRYVSSNSTFPPSWFVEYSLLDYLFVFRIDVIRAAGSQRTCSHGVLPLPARSLATASAQVSLPHELGVCPRAMERVAESPPGISREQHLDGTKWRHFARRHRTAAPLWSPWWDTQLTSFNTPTPSKPSRNARYAQDNAHTHLTSPR